MDFDTLRAKHDSLGIGDVLADYPAMLETGEKITAEKLPQAKTYVLSGMGGSALAGELYRDAIGSEARFQLYINRGYDLPGWVDPAVPVILSSYSGNTEEVLAVFDETLKRDLTVVAMGGGGELERRAGEHGVQFVKLPDVKGLPPELCPRLTLPYGFAALTKLLPGPAFKLSEVADFLRSLQEDGDGENPAEVIARASHKTLPSLYLDEAWQGVGKVWQAQFNENAKSLLELAVLSEANHNEIQTWSNGELPRTAVFLRSELDSERIAKRLDFTREHLQWEIVEHREEGAERLLTVWGMAYLGLWVSYYLSMLRGADPGNIDTLLALKDYLKQA